MFTVYAQDAKGKEVSQKAANMMIAKLIALTLALASPRSQSQIIGRSDLEAAFVVYSGLTPQDTCRFAIRYFNGREEVIEIPANEDWF